MENSRAQFPFPYQPYNIQDQFMQALYSVLDQGKVGIFESPTGTVGTVCVHVYYSAHSVYTSYIIPILCIFLYLLVYILHVYLLITFTGVIFWLSFLPL